MRTPVTIVLLSAVLSGCMSSRHLEPRTVAMCERGFVRDSGWERTSAWRYRVIVLRRQHASFGADATPARMAKSTTLWFKKPETGDFASCSKQRCEADRCFWRVQTYARKENDWHVALEYLLADPERK